MGLLPYPEDKRVYLPTSKDKRVYFPTSKTNGSASLSRRQTGLSPYPEDKRVYLPIPKTNGLPPYLEDKRVYFPTSETNGSASLSQRPPTRKLIISIILTLLGESQDKVAVHFDELSLHLTTRPGYRTQQH
jgi:hypothetical protein